MIKFIAEEEKKETVIREKDVTTLASFGCTLEEIAAFLDISRETLERRVEARIKTGHLKGFVSMKRKLFEMGMNGNLGAIVFYMKLTGYYREKQEMIHKQSDERDAIEVFEQFKQISA